MIPHRMNPKLAAAATGYSVDQLYNFHRQGLLSVEKINARVFRFFQHELETLHIRISEKNREALATVDNRSGKYRETEQGLTDIYGYVPGRRA